ncbi:Gamma interferon inducible lysosomal thiol reductase [Pleurostoma richardsiae]|uniref:Gamma interferon inducible lysosomal thiol reductase n=1 Tax=Pleurostoma richardsiae TaxID=41990 RepID=A0AA38R5E9_9PEZI|nr:Gamma interferon inducible lysosomal thiol reductase [Pleurostoma richardsiae]
MNEKRPLYARTLTPTMRGHPARRSRPALIVLCLISLCAYIYYYIQPLAVSIPTIIREDEAVQGKIQYSEPHANDRLVPLEAHIMSKCPDARDCLREMVLPVMQRVHSKVNFTLSFIGTPTENDGVDCMHGPTECMGNILELCAAKLYPDPKQYLGFVMCISRDYKDIPERSLIEDCALEHAIDAMALNDCAVKDDGEYGVDMLRNSVRRSSAAGVTKSCTVRLDEKVYCIRDGGEWKDCPAGPSVNDLVIAIEKLHRSA